MFSIEWYFPWSSLDWVLKAQLLIWIASILVGLWIARLGLQGRWLKGAKPGLGAESTTSGSRSDDSTP